MKLIVTALRPEAEPLIAHLKLKRDLSIHSHEVYRNASYALIITGMGKVASAVGTTLLLERYGKSSSILLNIGIAGAPTTFTRGELIAIHKIEDFQTKQAFYPEMLIQSGLREAALVTVDTPVISPESWSQNTLADMEGSGFFQAATSLVAVEQIAVLKVISDHFSTKEITKQIISDLIRGNSEKIVHFVESHYSILENAPPLTLSESEKSALESLSTSLKLTSSQKKQLFDRAIRSRVVSDGISQYLSSFSAETPTNTSERNTIYQELLDALPIT